MNDQAQIPDPPQFSEDELQKCRGSGDYMPILFEWYKFVGHLCIFFALIERESPAVREIPAVHYAVLTGLLNRTARLMLSNIALSHNGRFGETTALLDRSIFETCLKVQWLCHKNSDESFQRYLAEGLKTEVELKSEIESNIASREGNKVLNIEKRMLASIDRHIGHSGLSQEEIKNTKKLPDASAMLRDLGYERLMYVVNQRLGSHHIHGTWPSLLLHYLEASDDGSFSLRDHDCDTHPNQFVMTPLQVLGAVAAYIQFIMEDSQDIDPIIGLLDSVQEEILKINSEMANGDFDVAEEI